MLKADFHIHTKYSMDCTMPLEDMIQRCIATGINCIAIADHDSVDGAIEAQKLAPFPVIVAEEVLTPEGEIMGVRHKNLPVEGVQFHPESFMTQGGKDILHNFLHTRRKIHA